MKLPFVLPFAWLASLLGMDYTPPAVIPAHMREAVEVKKDESSYQDMPADHHHKHKRHSSQIVATMTDETGKEVKPLFTERLICLNTSFMPVYGGILLLRFSLR